MSLAHGGHLTRGSPVNLSGKLYRIVSYGLNAGEEIDYDAAEAIALAEKPKLVVTEPRPTRSPSTGSASAASRTNAARCSWPTSRITPG